MAPTDNLSPAGSSSYSSNTMYVGDGTWDATRNTFLLPNLVGLNFDTMQYNGMGNRFRDMPGYYTLVLGHAILAVIVFLFIVPAAILIARYYTPNARLALKMHIQLQIFTVLLTTVLFILGFMAVGQRRSLTNPHHGIGVALYVLILIQFLWGACVHSRERKRSAPPRKLPVRLVMHQWLGRAIALLGFAQVPLGLTLYGSPKYTFVLYAVWMFFLFVLFFVLSYRAMPILDGSGREVEHGDTVITKERSRSRSGGGMWTRIAAGTAVAAMLGRNRNKSRSRSRARREEEVVSSRRESGGYVEEKYEDRRESGGGFTGTLLKGAALVGAAGLAKTWFDRRQRKKEEKEYSTVAPDTPSRRHGRRHADSFSEDSVEIIEAPRPTGPILPGPGDPLLTAAALGAAGSAPATPRPTRRHDTYSRHSEDTDSYYNTTLSPSRRPQKSNGVRNGLLAGLGLGWIASRYNDRRDRKEGERVDRIERERVEEERLARAGTRPARLTGDGFPTSERRHGRRASITESSHPSSVVTDPHLVRPGAIPPIPAALESTLMADATRSSRTNANVVETVSMPTIPPDPHGVLHPESGSESYESAGGRPHRRHSSSRRREGDAAAAAAVAGAATLAAAEEERRRRSRSRVTETMTVNSGVASPPVSVKMRIHNDVDRHVTLRRVTDEEARRDREAKRAAGRGRRDSLSSMSGTESVVSRRQYRRQQSVANGEGSSSYPPPPLQPPPPVMEPLSPPNPAFAEGRRPKDSAYYSGQPAAAVMSGGLHSGVGSPGSHGTWSAMSPSVTGGLVPGSSGEGTQQAAERRRRRRLERNQRAAEGGAGTTVDFT